MSGRARQLRDDARREPGRVDQLAGREARVHVDPPDRGSVAWAAVKVSSCSSPSVEPSIVYAQQRAEAPRRRTARAPMPISSSGVKPIRSVGRGASGWAARYATAAMISAIPALSSAPSSVSPLEVTMSSPTLPASSGIDAGSSTRSRPRQLDHAPVVGAVDERLDARPGASGLASRWASRPIAEPAPSALAPRVRRHVAVLVDARHPPARSRRAPRPAARPSSSCPGLLGLRVRARLAWVSMRT